MEPWINPGEPFIGTRYGKPIGGTVIECDANFHGGGRKYPTQLIRLKVGQEFLVNEADNIWSSEIVMVARQDEDGNLVNAPIDPWMQPSLIVRHAMPF